MDVAMWMSAMSATRWIARALQLLAMLVLMVVIATSAAWAQESELESTLLATGDLPSGFDVVEESRLQSGASVLSRLSCYNSEFPLVDVARRSWGDGTSFVTSLVAHVRSDAAASTLLQEIDDCTQTFPRFAVGVPGATGVALGKAEADSGSFHVHAVFFARASRVFLLTTARPPPADTELAVSLARAQARRAGNDVTEPEGPFDPAYALGAALVPLFLALVLLPEAMDAYTRDRARARSMLAGPPSPGMAWVVDVGLSAKAAHQAALGRHGLEVLAAGTVGVTFMPEFWPRGPVVGAVLATVLLVFHLWRRGSQGGRRARLTPALLALLLLPTLGAVIGFGLVAAGAVQGANGERLKLLYGTSLIYLVIQGVGLLMLVGSVAMYRLAVRAFQLRADALLAYDHRPPVVYLRTFSDDRIRMRVAPFARRSLLERLSTHRRQWFEEVVAERLRDHGPVIAVNEPGRRLPPMGIAREQLPGEQWKERVRERTQHAHLIALVVGEGNGLEWEIREVARSEAWRKTLFVFPPVRADLVRQRWNRLGELLAGAGLREAEIPTNQLCLLVASFPTKQDCVLYFSWYPDAWAYGAAIDTAARDLLRAARASTAPS